MLPTRDPPQNKRPTQTESEGLETNFPSKWTGEKKAGVAILISDTEFKAMVSKNEDGGVGRHTAPPRTTRTDRKSNGKEIQY